MCDDGTQRVCFFPVSDVQFHDTWHSVGRRGTGSLDFSVEGVHVANAFAVVPTVCQSFESTRSTHI